METIKLLVLDDLSLIRAGIKQHLKEEENMEIVAEASTCLEANEFLDNNEDLIDILIMDVKFAECCGKEASKKILKKNKHLKILVFTQEQDKDSVTAMVKAGAFGYVLKEDVNELADAINTIDRGCNYYSYNVSVKMVNLFLDKKNPEKKILSERESQILKHVAEGGSNKIVGEKLNISSRTVETHRRNIIHKLCVKNTAEMISYAFSNRLIA